MLKYLRSPEYMREKAAHRMVEEFVQPYRENETINHEQLRKDVEELVARLSKPMATEKRKVWIS